MPTTRNLAILIFEGVGVLDFCGPFEVFSADGVPVGADRLRRKGIDSASLTRLREVGCQVREPARRCRFRRPVNDVLA
jgi:hypothetical protein